MADLAKLRPFAAELPTSNFPQLVIVNGRPVLAFDASTAERANWTFEAPQSLGSTLTIDIFYMMASATANGIAFDVAVEAITDGDTTDLDAASSFDSVNTGTATVPGTAGYIDKVSITLTNKDSIAAGDLVRVYVERATGNAGDTATGDLYFLGAVIRDA